MTRIYECVYLLQMVAVPVLVAITWKSQKAQGSYKSLHFRWSTHKLSGPICFIVNTSLDFSLSILVLLCCNNDLPRTGKWLLWVCYHLLHYLWNCHEGPAKRSLSTPMELPTSPSQIKRLDPFLTTLKFEIMTTENWKGHLRRAFFPSSFYVLYSRKNK